MRWVSLGVLAAAGLLLAAFWGDVPDRWISHWGVHGPDGWATKSAATAAAPLLIGFAAWIAIEAVALLLGRVTASLPAGLPPELRTVQATSLRLIGLGVAVLTAGIALALPLLQPRSPGPIVVAALAIIGIALGVAIAWSTRETRRLRRAGVAVPDGYHGAFYSNPRDSRLWVPKGSGIGWTLNFAHRRAWPVMIALVGAPLALALVLRLLAR